jgi:DNA-binding NarL/FixJ family response regulator
MTESAAQPSPITISIVDDHRVLTDALATIFRSQPDLHMQIVGVAETCAAARELLAQTCPDVLLLDVLLPDGDGLGLVPEFNRACPNTYILVLTALADEKTLMRAVETGVNGFIGKTQPLSQVIAAIRQAAEGEIAMPAGLLQRLLAQTAHLRARPVTPTRSPLTPREQEILTHLARGKSGQDIAAALNITPLTVRTHIRNLLEKLGVHSRLEAVGYALSRGLIEPPV